MTSPEQRTYWLGRIGIPENTNLSVVELERLAMQEGDERDAEFRVGFAPTHRISFFGAIPSGKPAVLPVVDGTAIAAAPTAAPAGGIGTAAGGFDTDLNRDAAIATINSLVARLGETTLVLNNTRTRLTNLETRLRTLGLLT